jgi:hypothetical protein
VDPGKRRDGSDLDGLQVSEFVVPLDQGVDAPVVKAKLLEDQNLDKHANLQHREVQAITLEQ